MRIYVSSIFYDYTHIVIYHKPIIRSIFNFLISGSFLFSENNNCGPF